MIKIKYNLKKILLEEDDIDLVDTSFMDKWDEVPQYEPPAGFGWHDGSDAAIKHDEYWADLDNHITDRLRSYVKDNPAVLDSLPSPSGGQTPHGYFRRNRSAKGPDWVQEYMDSRDDDLSWTKNHHPKNVRAETWIKEFNKFLEGVKSDPKSDEYFTGRWDVPNLDAWRYDDED